MPFSRPDLPTLIDRAAADIESRLPGADARLRRSNLNVLARVHAGAIHGLYGYLDWISKQILVDTADTEILDRHATIWLPSGRRPASYAIGQVVATGSDGTVIPAGTIVKRADGAAYSSETEVTIASSQAVITIVADVTGQASNAIAGTTLKLDSPIDGVNAAVTVTSGALTGGTDIEDDDSLRDRIIARIQQPPHGGAAFDYVAWAMEVPGVTRAWCYPGELGIGTVTIRFMRDDDATAIPDAAEVASVQGYVDDRRPVTANVIVVAPVPFNVNFVIDVDPATSSIKFAVEASLRDLILREAEPEGGQGEGKLLLSHIREAISLAAGEHDHTLILPTTDVVLTIGQIAAMGSITWV